MKSTIEQLTGAQRKALALFYETPTYEALKALCQLEIDGLAKDALDSPSQEQTRYYAGQAQMASKLVKLIRQLYKESLKSDDKQKG